MKDIIYKLLIEHLEIVSIANGDEYSTAIAIKDSIGDCTQNIGDIEAEAEILATTIADKLRKEHLLNLI